jgi:predicted RND superfamily exporter protein
MDNKDDRLVGARLVSQTQYSKRISEAISHDFIGFIVKAFILVVFLLAVLFRNPKKVLVALIPVVTGMTFMFGVMGLLGMRFNLFNIVATILVIGLGVDYGIFMVCRISERYEHDTEHAVLYSGLTTIAGFGALVLARHPALHSIGLTVLLGISAAIPSALFVIPAFYERK